MRDRIWWIGEECVSLQRLFYDEDENEDEDDNDNENEVF